VKTVELAQATESLSEYARRARLEAVVITLRGKPMATLMPVPPGADWESLAIGTHPKFLAIMERSRRAHRAQGGLSPEEVRRHFGIRAKRKPKAKAKRHR